MQTILPNKFFAILWFELYDYFWIIMPYLSWKIFINNTNLKTYSVIEMGILIIETQSS